jgi:hypothetical protein
METKCLICLEQITSSVQLLSMHNFMRMNELLLSIGPIVNLVQLKATKLD